MTHPVLVPGAVAVITGGASGIGLAAARRFRAIGMSVAIADLGREKLEAAEAELAAIGSPVETAGILASEVDVSAADAVDTFAAAVTARFGGVDVLMNNAGIGPGSSLFGPIDAWRRTIDVNFWGIVHGTRAFVPGMIARGRPGLVINTGSKQGITTPPGDPAYNVSKSGVKVYTEALQHELRGTAGCAVSAHLLIPGFVFTPLTAGTRTEKPAAAWTPDETVDFMLDSLERGDFYILCPDNDVPRSLDERRILWAAGDIVENRPPLSRWHPDFGDAFKVFAARTD
jgi:NAD(P)-dependent dehydrogenase (short-subunit alcohol dehydrogenase family)